MRNHHLFIIFLMSICLLFSACDDNRVYEKNVAIDNQEWFYDDAKSFEVEVTDTTQLYNLMVNIRHSNFYEWSNLWVVVETQSPDSTKMETKVNLPLAEATGKWYGNCSGDICTASVPIQESAKFPKTGIYTFTISQHMRVDPLPNIMDVGLRIEKYIPPTE